MKKTKKALIIFILIIITLSSCSTSNYYSDNDLYFYQGTFQSTLLKYNISTGKATNLCNDPLCSHLDENCIFYGAMMDIIVLNDNIYFIKQIIYNNGKLNYKLIKYNILNNNIKIIKESNNMISQLFLLNNKIYFWENIYINGINGADLYTLNISSEKIEKLTDTPEEYRLLKYASDEKNIYWSDIFNSGINYITDHNFKNKNITSILGHIINNYVYIREYNVDNLNYRLIKMNLNNNEKIIVCDNLNEFIIYNEKIYYLKFVENPKYIANYRDGTEVFDNYDGKLYVVDSDGNNNKLLCDLKDLYINSISLSFYNILINDNYIAIPITEYIYDDNDHIINMVVNDLAIININTGEWIYSDVK